MNPEEILKALRDCGCRRYEGESSSDYHLRSKSLMKDSTVTGSWCEFDSPCRFLTAEECLAFVKKYGCICMSPEVLDDAKRKGLFKKSICEHCCDSSECFITN